MKLSEGMVKVHLYNVVDILRPRGPLQKESLSANVLKRLEDAFESWSDKQYGDSLDEAELIVLLQRNFVEEMNHAWNEFMKNRL